MTSTSAIGGRLTTLGLALATAALLAGCENLKLPGSSSSASGEQSSTAGTASTASTAPKVAPGMNAAGEVVDPSKVEGGHGQKVKGLNDWEGEILGKPAPGSKFTQLKIGMSMRQVTDIAGQPSDQGAYITGKAWIPFYFGSDRHRFEMVYKNQGRLIFAGGSLGDLSGGNLIWIIHSAAEDGYR
jgi:hypothetical protein